MFDLNHAIAAWRRSLRFNRTFSSDDLDELEGHLRDYVDALIAEGHDPQAAFRQALQRLGHQSDMEREYQKVRWTAPKRRRTAHDVWDQTKTMLRTYRLTAWRSMRKQKAFTAINLTGLAVGLACGLMMLMYVHDELNYDRAFPESDRLYRVVQDVRNEAGLVMEDARTESGLGPLLEAQLPVVDQAARVMAYEVLSGAVVSRTADRPFSEPNFMFADSTFFDLFAFPFVAGDPQTALDRPFSLVITQAMAQKYFGNTPALGQPLTMKNDAASHTFTVTGVVDPSSIQTHLVFDFVASFSSLLQLEPWMDDMWHWAPLYTYIRTTEPVEVAELGPRITALVNTQRQEARLSAVTYHVQPVPAIHLYSSRPNEIALNGQATYVYLFGLAALCVLLIACINFMNLMTARSAQRAKEVGMRKALGAHRTQLVRQFLGEATVQTFVGALLALGLIALLLPAFNLATGKALTFGQFVSGPMLLLIAGLVLGVGALAGSYPAFVLSAFRPVSVLRGSVEGPAAARIRLRKGLVVFQFAISSLLLIGTVVVYQQLMYMQSANLGFDKEHVVVVRLRDQENQQAYNSLKQAWLQHPHVETVSGTSAVPGYDGLYEFLVVPQDDARVDSVRVRTLSVDADFTEALGLNVVQGRDFMEAAPADQNGAFLINEAMARQFGWTQPVGNELRLDFHLRGTSTKYGEVVGLVRDFHYTSMHSVVEPIIIHLVPPSYYIDYLVVRVQPGAIMETMGFLEDEWRAFSPSRPFDYTFLDAEFEALYRNEARLSRVFAGMAGLAIFVACLGLFGLAAYTAQQRTKEIGVRKVIGASTPHLVLLLAGDFIKLVLVAFALAAPVAFLLMQRWLQDFAYHVDLGVSHFALASALIVTVALLTVGYQTIRAALMDPVRALKYE